jgi:hypothetical protein
MSFKGDLKKIRRRAEDQGWRVEKRKEFWLFYPIDKRETPCKLRHTVVLTIMGEFPVMYEAKGI